MNAGQPSDYGHLTDIAVTRDAAGGLVFLSSSGLYALSTTRRTGGDNAESYLYLTNCWRVLKMNFIVQITVGL